MAKQLEQVYVGSAKPADRPLDMRMPSRYAGALGCLLQQIAPAYRFLVLSFRVERRDMQGRFWRS